MPINLNFSPMPEYDLNESLVDEMINMYGVNIKLLITEKINVDDNVFGDFTHMKSNTEDTFEMFALPEEAEDFSTDGYSFSPFGNAGFDNVVLFLSKNSLKIDGFVVDNNVDYRKVVSNLIIFPNNKIMEITDVDPCVPGVNNLFTQNNAKSVYKLTCKPYQASLVHEVSSDDITAPTTEVYPDFDDFATVMESDDKYETLDNYFDELTDVKSEQDSEVSELSNFAEVISVSKSDTGIDVTTPAILVDKSTDDVWGNNA